MGSGLRLGEEEEKFCGRSKGMRPAHPGFKAADEQAAPVFFVLYAKNATCLQSKVGILAVWPRSEMIGSA